MEGIFLKLTPKEMQIARLIMQGLSNKEMARLLNNSARTIEVHRMKIFQKLGVKNSTQMVLLATGTNSKELLPNEAQVRAEGRPPAGAAGATQSTADRILGAALLKIEHLQLQLDEVTMRLEKLGGASKE